MGVQAEQAARGIRHAVERAEGLGGSSGVTSAPGRGTSIDVNLPLERH